MDFASNTRNTRRLGAAGLATLFALLSGCFSEPAGNGSSGTDGPCDPGAFSCECFEGSCKPDLRCTPSNICIADDCMPGTAICECDGQSRCGVGLECTSGVCLPQDGTTVTSTNTDSNSTTSTTGTSTTMPTDTMPSTTSTSVETETSTTGLDTTDATESATGIPASCVADRLDCPDCFSCTNASECASEFDACESITDCTVVAACIADCTMGICFADCCEGESQSLTDAAEALNSCRRDTCILSSACESFTALPIGFCGA